MVPELQISKKVDFVMIYMFFLVFFCFVMNEVFWRFGELSSILTEFTTRDLQVFLDLQINKNNVFAFFPN